MCLRRLILKILKAAKIHIVLFGIITPRSLAGVNSRKEPNDFTFTTEVPLLNMENVIRNTAITHIRLALLLKMDMTTLRKWYPSLFMDNTTVLERGYSGKPRHFLY